VCFYKKGGVDMKSKIVPLLLLIVAILLGIDIFVRLGVINIADSKTTKISPKEDVKSTPKIDENIKLLMEADAYAKQILDRIHYQYPSRLRDAGVLVDPYKEADYTDIIFQLYLLYTQTYNGNIETMKRSLIEMVGYNDMLQIIYILQHYDEWKETYN